MRRTLLALQNTRVAYAAILFFGLLAMTARHAIDPDLWWHLRTGQWIVENGHIPHADPFSFTRAGQAWVSHEWLTEIIFYELWKHLGAPGLIAFSAIVTAAGFMLLYLRCPGKRYWAAAATVIGALAAAPSFGSRPQMFTFTFASLLLWLIETGERRPRLLLWIPPLFLLWLNLHAGFALGLALLFAYGLGLVLETALGNTPWPQSRPLLIRIALLFVACLLLVPLNPSGAQLYRYPLDTLRSPGMRSLIAEWFSPDFHQDMYRPLLFVWLSLLIALAYSRARPRGRVMLPLLLTAFAALDAARHVPIFILLAMPVIAAALPQTSSSVSFATHRPPSRFRPIFVGSLIVLMALLACGKWITLARSQEAREAKTFPARAVAAMHTGDFPRNIFVYYDWGGYVIWKLYPQYRVFVDGRADLYGDELLRQFKVTVQLRNGWKHVLDTWHVDTVLAPPSSALSQALVLEPEWHTAYADSEAILLVRGRSNGENAVISEELPQKSYESEKMFPTPLQNLRN